MVRHDVVEGVVATLQRLLVGETGLLEQVDDHVGSGKLSLLLEEWKSQELCYKLLKLTELKWIRMNFPNLEELSFLTVLALPQASRTGLVWTILSSREASPSFLFPEEQMVAK